MAQIPQTGDAVPLFQSLLSATWYGIISDGSTPGGVAATLEMVDDEAVITTDVLVGPKGEPGRPAPIVELQWPAVEQLAELEPLKPTLTAADAGKGWICGVGLCAVWDGRKFNVIRLGPAGPVGATPQISVTAETIPLADRVPGVTDEVIQSGTSLQPHLHFRLLSPQGPEGPPTNILDAPDYDDSQAPEDGQSLTWNEQKQKWQPSDFNNKHPRLYSIPERAFTDFNGLTQRHTILSYTMPEQDFDWVPYVQGHIRAWGIEFDSDPLVIGCEVRIGDAFTGQMIGRGFGDISNWTHIKPHFSSPGDPTSAVAPDNGVATVKAGERATISVNLANDGIFGSYAFNRKGAQVTIMVVPTGI